MRLRKKIFPTEAKKLKKAEEDPNFEAPGCIFAFGQNPFCIRGANQANNYISAYRLSDYKYNNLLVIQ